MVLVRKRMEAHDWRERSLVFGAASRRGKNRKTTTMMSHVQHNANDLAIATYIIYTSSILLATLITARALSKPKAHVKKSPSSAERRPRVQFNNRHGISGTYSTILTCFAIAAHQMLPTNYTILTSIISILAAIMSISTASSGMSMVEKAPKQTVVMQYPIKVVPPHRDAFRRTAYSIYYLSARICRNAMKMYASLFGNVLFVGGSLQNAFDWLFGCISVAYAMNYFLPRAKVDWTNGNTFVFVVPMAIGLSCDALFQLPILQCRDELCWNVDVVDHLDLLCVLMSGLVVAFAFTLAFHGVLGIRKCYWVSALVVHGIVLYLIRKALPYLGMLALSR